MTQRSRPFFAWPGWRQLGYAWLLTLLVTAWFCLVFVGSDWFTAQRPARMRVHFGAELAIPLVPAFTVVYMSIYALFLAVPFVLRTRREITTLAIAQAGAILAGGIGFLLIPGRLAYAPPRELGIWKPLFQFADRLNLDYNLVPSLHVALSVACIEMFVPNTTALGKTLLRGWGILIAASTLLTHQHHVVDVVTGYLLALATVYWARQVTKGGASKNVRKPLK